MLPIDKYASGIASSIKSLDLNAKSYQTASALNSKLVSYVDKLSAFTEKTWNGVQVGGTKAPVIGKQLELIVPHGGSATQKTVLKDVVDYGKSLGIDLIIHIVQ